VSSSQGTARCADNELNGLANVARCASGAASASLVRALRAIQSPIPPELSPHAIPEIFGTLSGASTAVCSLDALRTVGVPDELLALACAEGDPVGAGSSECGCGGLCDVDSVLMEDPDNRPYVWDQEEKCH